jgi:hypothetical protein
VNCGVTRAALGHLYGLLDSAGATLCPARCHQRGAVACALVQFSFACAPGSPLYRDGACPPLQILIRFGRMFFKWNCFWSRTQIRSIYTSQTFDSYCENLEWCDPETRVNRISLLTRVLNFPFFHRNISLFFPSVGKSGGQRGKAECSSNPLTTIGALLIHFPEPLSKAFPNCPPFSGGR